MQRRSAGLEAGKDAIALALVEVVRRLALDGGANHQLYEALANDWCAERDGDELVDLCHDLWVEATELKVPAAVAALAYNALGHGVQADQLDGVVFPGVLLLHVAQDGLEAVELADEDVGLVDFVGEDDEVLLGGKVDDGFDVFVGEGGAGGVAGVDDGDGADVGAGFLCGGEGGVDAVDRGGPVVGFVEVVGDAGGVEEGEGCGVEGVLGDGDEDTSFGARADDVQEGVDTGGGAGAEVDGGGVCGVAITVWKWC